jgi:hypothetical protein
MLPSEAAMAFLKDNTAIAVVRRSGGEKKAVMGKAHPPYTDWTWTTLDRSIADPCLQQLADGRIIVSGRFSEPSTHTGLCWLDADDGTTEEFLSLPSGGYTGNPSIQVQDNDMLVAYFSSHEGATANYVARLSNESSRLSGQANGPPNSTTRITGTFLVRWRHSAGKTGDVEYEFAADGSVRKAGSLIGRLTTAGQQPVLDYDEDRRGSVVFMNVTRDSFTGTHTWADGTTATWTATRTSSK